MSTPTADQHAVNSGAWSAAAVAEALGRLFNTYTASQARNNALSHPGQGTLYNQPPAPMEVVTVKAFGINWAIIAVIAAVALVAGVIIWRR